MAERKGCHGGETKMVPRQHSGSGNSIEVPVEKNTCDGSVSCEERWGAPGYRVPTCRRHGNEEEQLRFTGEYNNQTCISYNTCIRSTGVVSGLYLRSVQRGRFSFGDRGTHVEGEVVVHGVVIGSRGSRDGS